MTPHRELIVRVSRDADISPNLVEAFVLQESGGNPWAWNPEPKYPYLWNVRTGKPFRTLAPGEATSKTPPADFPTPAGDRDQEWWGQQASWGLMQLMGAVARENGFTGAYLPELVDPHINILIGCKVLSRLKAWADGDIRKTAAAYNAGRGGYRGTVGQHYATEVLTLLDSVNTLHPETR
jgi:hypothetical protein